MDSDAIVIGAGLIGLAISRELTRAGISVTVLEKGKTAKEASWAGAGMLSPHGENLPNSFWAEKAVESLHLYPSWIKEISTETGLRIDYRACGTVEFHGSERREFPDEALVDPRELTAALAQNADLQEGREVFSLDELKARWIIVAAGAWSGSIRGLPVSFPVRGHLLGYEMPPGSLSPILRRGNTYVAQRSNGFTLVGSNEETVGFNRELDSETLNDLEIRGAALWPELQGKRPVTAWCGFRPATPSGVPEVGRIEGTNIWKAYGHFRNGILLAPVTAKMIAQQIISASS